MKRRQTWPEDLAAYLESRRSRPFEWVENDCTTFALGAVQAMTGDSPPVPAYGSAAAAARLLAWRSLRDRVGDAFGPEIVPSFARRGDLVLLELDGRETLGVCDGDWIAGPGAAGLVLAPRAIAVAAWRV